MHVPDYARVGAPGPIHFTIIECHAYASVMDVNVRNLRYFVAVAEELSVTRAAERLYVSQPALSKQIQTLERSLRVTLLQRDPRGVTLTAAGSELLAHARPLLTAWDAAVGAVQAAADVRVLRLGMQTSLGRSLYPAVRARFTSTKPDWGLTLRLYPWTDPSVGLLDRGTDAAFVWLPVPAGLSYEVLLHEPRWVALPQGHRLASLSSVAFSDLLDEPFVALPASAGSAREFWLGSDARGGKPANVALEVNSPDETFEAVASGLGVHLLAAGNADIYARPGVVCRPVDGLSPCELAVAWREDDARAEVRAFVAACVAAVTS
jgi:DNA-binding transcriptional LysR family regulator